MGVGALWIGRIGEALVQSSLFFAFSYQMISRWLHFKFHWLRIIALLVVTAVIVAVASNLVNPTDDTNSYVGLAAFLILPTIVSAVVIYVGWQTGGGRWRSKGSV